MEKIISIGEVAVGLEDILLSSAKANKDLKEDQFVKEQIPYFSSSSQAS